MRRIWLLWFFTLFMLFGCQDEPIKTPDETNTDTEIITLPNDDIVPLKTLTVINLADAYDIPEQTINFYQSNLDENVNYINVSAFLHMMRFGLSEYTISRTDNYKISVTLYGDNETPLKDLTLTLDAKNNYLIYNDFNFHMALTGIGNETYETDLIQTSFASTSIEPYVIDLNPYGIDILENEGTYYIPFELANLVLTGYALSVYHLEDTLYIFDDISSLSSYVLEGDFNAPENSVHLIDYANRYSALIFDYFYGLKDYHEVDSYLKTFDDLNFEVSTTLATFSGKFQNFVYDLDDLHTAIYDYGYDRDYVSSHIEPPLYSKTMTYLNSYLYHCAFSSSQNISMIEYASYYVLNIPTFDDQTKDSLSSLFKNVKPEKDIYINLSCNSGGSIIATVELLTYMTNDPIEISYMNTSTKQVYHETYISKTPRALSNQFYVVTTPVTYSAAHIFTSIVKDMDLGLIIGQPTAGGAAALSVAVLPHNLIMSYSSAMVFLNKNGYMIEDSISPDILMDSYMKASQIIDASTMLYKDRVSYDVIDTSTNQGIDITFDTITLPDHMLIETYKVEYINKDSNQVIKSYEKDTLDFTIEEHITHQSKLIEIRITAFYTYHDKSFNEVIYQSFIDELSEEMSPDTYTLDLGVKYQTTKHTDDDVDYIKLVITETDVYRIKLNDIYQGPNACMMYREDGTKVSGTWHYVLEPGIYYLWVNLSNVAYSYTVEVVQMFDDNVGATDIIVTENETSVTLSFDFEYDTEWISMTLENELLVTISSNQYIPSTFYIARSDGTMYHSHSDYLHFSLQNEFVLPKGTFLFKFHEQMIGSFTFKIKGQLIPNDLSGDDTLEDQRFGILEPGVMDVLFEHNWDKDIYVYETDFVVDLMFLNRDGITICHILENSQNCDTYDKLIHLEPGTHYFSLMSVSQTYPKSNTIEIVVLKDESDENNMIPIVLDEPFEVIIEKDGDIDYYTLSVLETGVYKFLLTDGHSSTITIYDKDSHQLYLQNYGTLYAYLIPGDYVITISENISNMTRVQRYVATVSILDTLDPDPNVIGFDHAYYRTLTGDNTLLNKVFGTLSYSQDKDIYLLTISTSGVYQYSSLSNITVYLVDQAGKQTLMRKGWSYQLDAGTYYLRVSSQSASDTQILEYDFSFFLNS